MGGKKQQMKSTSRKKQIQELELGSRVSNTASPPYRPYLLYFITLYLGGTEREQTRQKPPGSGWVGARTNALANPKGLSEGSCGAKKRAQTTEAALNWIFIVKCGECVGQTRRRDRERASERQRK